jgi:hypothetical protein
MHIFAKGLLDSNNLCILHQGVNDIEIANYFVRNAEDELPKV